MFNTAQNRFQLQKVFFFVKDTVDDSSSLDVSLLTDMQLDKLAKAAGVVVVHGLGVPKGLHDGTAGRRGREAVNRRGRTIGKMGKTERTNLLCNSASSTWDVLSRDDTSSECWLMHDRNFRISLVLSVLPAPLSPLGGDKASCYREREPVQPKQKARMFKAKK